MFGFGDGNAWADAESRDMYIDIEVLICILHIVQSLKGYCLTNNKEKDRKWKTRNKV